MALTHVLGFTADGGLSQSVSLVGGLEVNVDEDIASSVTDFAVAFAADISQILSIFFLASVPLTVETNSGSSPGVTLSLAANKPIVWYPDIGTTVIQLLTVDITSLFITNAGAATTLKIRCLIDPTV